MVGFGLLGLAAVDGPAVADDFSENEVKAVFLYNFASFINWPQDVRQDPAKPFRYCVLDDELVPLLQNVLKGETMRGRPLSVQREVTASNVAECHILYMGTSGFRGAESWKLVQAALSAQVLTVSDMENFESNGGMIALVRQDRRIHPRINIDMVEKGKLRISAKLLNLATVVRDSTSTGR
ncbi:MAG: YfiR family protein [Candidatus Competibacteraceae bacterium]|nr:YfiR family protein [Candidatus Competibacteraceae bacterium]